MHLDQIESIGWAGPAASRRTAVRTAALITFVGLLALGCASFNPPNERLAQVDPAHGYRPQDASRHRDPGRLWVMLAFSGGGTRAAAFAYGVLEGLRDTEVVIGGAEMRLLDEVDTISGVSGGSFPAAYYGLFGDRIFDDFEERFLKRNVQRALAWRVLNPWNLIRLMTPYLSRSDIASRYYDKKLLDRATFADLAAARGPRIHINATDLPSGNNFRFNQDAFDIICSDLDPFPVSYAVAASSAVPVLLSPITLRNYGGSCGLEPPAWFEEALKARATNPRGWRAAQAAASFMDSSKKRYVHLVDGGISDNLGVRVPLDRIAMIGDIERSRQMAGLDLPDHLVVVVVNAETEPDPLIDLKAKAPSLSASLNLVSGAQIRRYNFESLLLVRSAVHEFEQTLSRSDHPVRGHLVEVSFDMLGDEEERRYFKRLPTSFSLTDEQVDRLREVGHRLLTESPDYKALVEQLR
jgi:NTE family protein